MNKDIRPQSEIVTDEDRLYQEYLRVVEGFAWYRTYYPGDAYANETLENLDEARKGWDKTLVVEPIDAPEADGKRDGFEYVRVTQRRWSEGNIRALWGVSPQQRVLSAMQARRLELEFAAELRRIVREQGTAENDLAVDEANSDQAANEIVWECMTASAHTYFRAAIRAVTRGR
jgi:hypothetical protein